MITPLFRPLFLAATLIIFGSTDLLRAQADFKGVRPANPPVHRRSSLPNSESKRANRAGARPTATDQREKVEEAIELGNQARDAENYQEALTQYKRALAFNPREARAFYGLGNVYQDKWNPKSGELSTTTAEEFEKSLQAYKENATRTYQNAIPQEAADAIQAYKRAIRLKPDYAEAYYNLGNVYQELGRLTEAAAQYESAIRFKPFDDPSKRIVTTYTPNLALAFTYFLLSRYAEAIEQAQKIVNHDPDYYGYERLALMYETQKRWAEAAEAEQQAIRLSSNNDRPYYRLGLVYHAQQRYAEAIEQYKSAIQHSSTPREVIFYHYNLGLAYINIKDKSGATEQYQSLRRKSEEFTGYDYLREAKKQAEDFADKLLQEINKL
jgi:tetratricopeptide (TPR) repeat protein